MTWGGWPALRPQAASVHTARPRGQLVPDVGGRGRRPRAARPGASGPRPPMALTPPPAEWGLTRVAVRVCSKLCQAPSVSFQWGGSPPAQIPHAAPFTSASKSLRPAVSSASFANSQFLERSVVMVLKPEWGRGAQRGLRPCLGRSLVSSDRTANLLLWKFKLSRRGLHLKLHFQ